MNDKMGEFFNISVNTRNGNRDGMTTVMHWISASEAAGIQLAE